MIDSLKHLVQIDLDKLENVFMMSLFGSLLSRQNLLPRPKSLLAFEGTFLLIHKLWKSMFLFLFVKNVSSFNNTWFLMFHFSDLVEIRIL